MIRPMSPASFLSYPNWRNLSISIPRKISPIDLIVLVSYYLFSLFLILSLAGLFKKEFIVLGLIVGFLLFFAFFWKRIEFKPHYLYFFIIIPILFTGVLLVKGYFEGMGMNTLLPWAREIALQERIPDSFVWFMGKMPLMPLFYAGIFSFLGFADWVIAILPFFFSSASLLLMYFWLSAKGITRKYLIFGILLILANPLFLDVGMHPLQEPFLLFFFSAFFYYLEKSNKTGQPFYFLLLFLSAVLAASSKETGLILFLPLAWFFIKKRLYKRPYCYLLFLTFPLFLWLLRNYIVFDNPLYILLNEIFKGRFYNLNSTVYQISTPLHSFWSNNNVLARIADIPVALVLSFFPLIILSFYRFLKKRKIQYILLFFIFLLTIFLAEHEMSYGFIRYLSPFLVLFAVYAALGLEEVKSRIFLSIIFFINLWGLFFTKLPLSKSQFIAPLEGILNNFRDASQFVYDYRLVLALALGIFFFFVISSDIKRAKYLVWLSAATYLVKTSNFQLGSWLNIWLPILGLIFMILTWRVLIKLKEVILLGLIVGYIIISLFLNSWGMAIAYFLTHDGFMFPNVKEAYGYNPEIALKIEGTEGENRDFYILADNASYFTWYYNFKIAIPTAHVFYIITNLEYKDSLTPSEIHGLFKRSKIKYVTHKEGFLPQLEPLYDKIKSRPDLFEPIFQKDKIRSWRIKS